MSMKIDQQAGFALVEALVAAAMLSTILAFSVSAYLLSAQIATSNGAGVEAAFLADEGVDAVRVLRDKSWSTNIATLSVGTTYHLAWSGSTWNATTTDSYIDTIFERSFILSDVYRDGNSDIAASGTLDSNTKKVTVNVSWFQKGATTTRSFTVYITNFLKN